MGAALAALRDTFGVVKRNPIVLLLAFVTQIGMVIGGAVLGIIPLIGPLISSILVTPTLLGGYYFAADRAHQTGDTGFDAFTQGMSENWKSLAGAYALVMVLGMGFVFVVAIAAMLMGASVLSAADPSAGASAAALSGSMMFVFPILMLVFILAAMVIQFIDVAIVVGDENATSTYGKAWSLFRDDPLSVFGYTILRVAVPIVLVAIPAFLMGVTGGMAGNGGASSALMLLFGIMFLVLYPVVFAITMTYHVVYFRYREDGW